MRPSTIWYIIKQGFKNIRRNWMFSVASILNMAACIFLVGVFYVIMANVNHNVRLAEGKIPITVFFEIGTTQEEIDWVGEQIRARPDVQTITFVSADEAWDNFSKTMFPENSAAAEIFRDDNPLVNDSNYQITVNNISLQSSLVKYIEGLDHVREVKQSVRAADFLTDFIRMLNIVSLVIIGILLLLSLFLISNTVSIGISVRKEEISIMKYIGATDRFVRAPFVLEGVLLGAVGAAIPLISLYFVYETAIRYIWEYFNVLSGSVEFLSVERVYRVLLPMGILLGVGVGYLSSSFTSRRHVRV